MSRNGSGTYSAPSGSFNPAINGNSATAADWNTLLADLVAAMTQSVSADGQTPIAGNFNMGNNKLTSLGAGSATGQSLAWQQLFSQGTESDLSSAGTTDIGAQNTNFLRITGTTSITSFGTNYNGPRFLRFAGALTLTHNATTLILPGGLNITTSADDTAIAIPISGGWYVFYQRNVLATPILQNYQTGFTCSTPGSSTTLTMSAGQVTDSTNSVYITLPSDLAKTTANFVQGAGGGLTTGTIQNFARYHAYAIRRPDTGACDVAYDLSPTAPNFSAAALVPFTQRRLLPHILVTNGSGQWGYVLNRPVDKFSVERLQILDLTGLASVDVFLPMDDFETFTMQLVGARVSVNSELTWRFINNVTPIAGANDYASNYLLANGSSVVAGGNLSTLGNILGSQSAATSTFTSSALMTLCSPKINNTRAQLITEGYYIDSSTTLYSNIKYTSEYNGATTGINAARTGIRFSLISGVWNSGRLIVMGVPK
jgi:hypothetical protein